MKEERVMILNMLQEGRITVDESMRLLDALHGEGKSNYCKREKFLDEKAIDEKVNKFSQSVENMAKDFCTKIENAYKDIEPKLKKASTAVVEKTANVVDHVAKSLNETLDTLKLDEEEKCDDKDAEDIMQENSNGEPPKEDAQDSNEN